MKKKIILLFLTSLLLTGCGEEQAKTKLQEEIIQLENTKNELEISISELQEKETAEKIRVGEERYFVILKIEQTHFTLDLEEHFKDSMNALEIPFPVDKEFYDSVDNGTVIDDSFRSGSFLMKGSVGNWKISVIDKYIE